VGRARLIGVVIVIQACGIMPMLLVGSLAVQIRDELDFSPAKLGLATSAFLLGRAAGSVTMGRMVDRLGARKSIRIGVAGIVICVLGVASLAQNWGSLVAWMIFGGISQALIIPAVSRYLLRVISPRHLGFAFGLKQSGPPLASLFAGLALPVVGLTVGWRWAFVGTAVLAVVAVLAVPRPVRVSALRGHTGVHPQRRRSLVWLSAGIGLNLAAVTSLSTFFVESAVTAGIPAGTAGVLLAVGSILAIGSRVVLGLWTDRLGREPLEGITRLLGLGTTGYLMLATGNGWLLTMGALLAFALCWGVNGLFFLSVARRNPLSPGAAIGVVVAGSSFGAMLGPPLFGLAVQPSGFALAWLIAAGWAVTGLLAVAHSQRVHAREEALAA
jgi:MFS family permease